MLEDLRQPDRVYPCKVRTVAETLDAKDQEILLKAVNNHEWSFKGLYSELRKRGLIIADGAIAKHRRQQCSCFRKEC
jgi:hypothetical protein